MTHQRANPGKTDPVEQPPLPLRSPRRASEQHVLGRAAAASCSVAFSANCVRCVSVPAAIRGMATSSPQDVWPRCGATAARRRESFLRRTHTWSPEQPGDSVHTPPYIAFGLFTLSRISLFAPSSIYLRCQKKKKKKETRLFSGSIIRKFKTKRLSSTGCMRYKKAGAA